MERCLRQSKLYLPSVQRLNFLDRDVIAKLPTDCCNWTFGARILESSAGFRNCSQDSIRSLNAAKFSNMLLLNSQSS